MCVRGGGGREGGRREEEGPSYIALGLKAHIRQFPISCLGRERLNAGSAEMDSEIAQENVAYSSITSLFLVPLNVNEPLTLFTKYDNISIFVQRK